MDKRYDKWFPQKKILDQRINPPSFKQREVWWCHVGVNVGYELFGKGDTFTRPVLVIKKYSKFMFLGAPLSTRSPRSPLHIPTILKGKDGVIRLDQLRTYDARRLNGPVIERLTPRQFEKIKNYVRESLK